MSKNFDLIATVDIDLTKPIVDGTSFDNVLIIGPGPKGEFHGKDVGVFSGIEEVEDAGFVTSGENADPVGVAARIAYSQDPNATLYIAVQKHTPAALAAQKLIEVMSDALAYHTTAYEKKGCSVEVDYENRAIDVVLTVPFAKADGHGLFQALAQFVEQGYSATIDGITVEHYGQFKQTVYDAQLLEMKQGDNPISFTMIMVKEGEAEVPYVITISYPDPKSEEPGVTSLSEAEEIPHPEDELEPVGNTVRRALAVNGWYAMCTAGVPSAQYEEIASLIEPNEKLFIFVDNNYFANGEKSAVGNVYYRSIGVYSRETAEQAEDEIPEANLYANVAFAVKWLSYEAGSETAAHKQLSAVYPSDLSTTDMKSLDSANMNYYVPVGNVNLTINGKVMAGEWADVIRFRDWQKNDMLLDVLNIFVVNPKVPYTDGGIALVQNKVIASLKRGRSRGGIAPDEYDELGNLIPSFTTSVPRASSITAAEKASRKLKNVKFKARLAGAIHFAEIKGSLTYEL